MMEEKIEGAADNAGESQHFTGSAPPM